MPGSRPEAAPVKPLYLALSGGGAHAAAHAGVLRALEREGVPVAGIAGVSGGALVAAAWAGGADFDRLVDQASRLHPWMWVRGWGGGLLSGSRLGALIDEFLPTDSFEALRVPVVVLATDVDTGEGGRLPRGQPARRGAGLLQLPRLLPALRLERPPPRGRGRDRGRARPPRPARWPASRASSWPSTATRAAGGRPRTPSSRSPSAPGSPSCAAARGRSSWGPTS